MRWNFAPIILQSYATLGYEAIMGPGSFVSNICQGAASIAVSLKTKNEELKQTAMSAGITALFGVTEPALFGVTITQKSILQCVILGGAVGGLFAGLMGVVRYTSGTPGLLSFAIFIGENPMNVVWAFVSAGIGFVVTFVSVLVWGYREPTSKNEKPMVHEESDTICIDSPMEGKCIDVTEVNDEAFSQEIVGKGVAIVPSVGEVVAPFDGKVVMAFDTKHALGLVNQNGVELLIHVGIDTVKLNGKYFNMLVKTGDEVKKGTKLLEFDMEAMKEEGYDVTTPVIVTNQKDFDSYEKLVGNDVYELDPILKIK